MKFKLARQILRPEISKVISREMRKQKFPLSRISKKELKELAELARIIETQGLPSYLVCKKLPHDLGSGIFLHPNAAPILRDQVIAPYSGELTIEQQNLADDACYAFAPLSDMYLEKEEQSLFDKNARYHPKRLYSLKLDAEKKGNFTRFINHSDKPNVAAHTVAIPKNPYGLEPSCIEIVYFAKKTIHPGEQLLVCYEAGDSSYWNALDVQPFHMTPKTFQLTSSLKLKQNV